MNFKNFLIICIAFVSSLNIMLSADKDSSQKKEELGIEWHTAYFMESFTQNIFLGIGVLYNYDLAPSKELSAIVDFDLIIGFYGAKKVNEVNCLAGLRFSPRHENFRVYYEISTGISTVNNHDNEHGYTGNFSRLKVGYGYKFIALEISVGAFVAKDFTIAPMEGIGLAVTF
jgi:hypothetical protein